MIDTLPGPGVVRALPREVSQSGAWGPTRASALIEATPAEIMRVIANVGAYPQWIAGVRRADVLARGADGLPAQVRLLVGRGDVTHEHTYTYRWHGDRGVDWSLDSSRSLRSLEGAYALTPIDNRRTVVTYQLTLETKVGLVGPLRRRAELVFINRALPHLKQRAEHPVHIPAARKPAE